MDGRALKYAADGLKIDEEIVFEAVKQRLEAGTSKDAILKAMGKYLQETLLTKTLIQ